MTTREYVDRGATAGSIDGYGEESARIKQAWLAAGGRIARKLAKALGLEKGEFSVRTNPAGPAVSGDVTLHADWVYVSLSQSCAGLGDMFMWRYCDSQRDFTGHANQWERWTSLLDLPRFAEAVKRNRP